MATIAQKNYAVHLYVKNSSGEKVYLIDAFSGFLTLNKAFHVDSAFIVGDSALFSGSFTETTYYAITIGAKKNFAPFIIDTGNIIIRSDSNHYETLWNTWIISNSSQNEMRAEVRKTINTIFNERERLQDSLLKYEDLHIESSVHYYATKMDTCDLKAGDFMFNYVKIQPDCYQIFGTLNEFIRTPIIRSAAARIFPLFSSDIRNSAQGYYFSTLLYSKPIDSLEGKRFSSFVVGDTKRTKIKLDLNVDKCYLIDYWASWCSPCLEKIPALRKLDSAFHHKGLRIISISLDNNYSNWIKAIKKYHLFWTNYGSLQGFEAQEARAFQISEIPFTILVGKNKKIIKFNPTDADVRAYMDHQR